ncbi:MAG: EAL domain-containing protein [Oscillospiraceae bacterium]
MKRKIILACENSKEFSGLSIALSDTYLVLHCENGRGALDLLSDSKQYIDGVLIDLSAPSVQGFEFFNLKSREKIFDNVPVIAISKSIEDEMTALNLGACDFILSPYNPSALKKRLMNLLSFKDNLILSSRQDYDSLTGIYNKDAFYRKSEEFLSLHSEDTLAVICLNIERFKVVNDLFGSFEGDKLLKYIAEKIREYFDDYGGVFGRIGADNFALLIPFHTGLEKEIEQTILCEIDNYPLDLKLTVRFGIYMVEDKSVPVEIMCDRANLAIAQIKGMYQNYYSFYSHSLRDKLLSEQELINDMHSALLNGEFHIYYQPKFDLATNKMVGAEALVRWLHPTKGVISPDNFIPIFEKNGFITTLDMYIWENTCKNMQRWAKLNFESIPISVNVSRVDVYNPHLCEIICNLCDKYDISHSLLDLEITETAYTQSPKQLIEIASRLKSLGFRIVMDDFGSGYSSLNMFNEVPVDTIKLDMGFLHDKGQSPLNGNILNFVVNMAKWLNIPVVAEGVETQQQVNFLKSMGCNQGLGYFYFHPLPCEEFEKLLSNATKYSPEVLQSTVNGVNLNDFWDPNSQFNLLFDLFVGAIMIVERNGQTLSILRANDRWYDIFGSDRAKIFNAASDICAHIFPDDRETFLNNMHDSNPKSSELVDESRWVNPIDGEIKWLRSRVRTIFRGVDRSISIASTEDITLTMQTQAHLSEALKRSESIAKSIPGGVFSYSPDSGKFDYISDNLCNMLGYTREEFRDKFKDKFENLIYEDDRSNIISLIDMSLNSTPPFDVKKSYRIQTKSGKLIWVHDEGNLVHDRQGKRWIYVVLVDISRQKEIEKELRINIRQMDKVFQHSEIDMWRYDFSNRLVSHISGSFALRGILKESMSIEEFAKTAYVVHPDFLEKAAEMNRRLRDGEKHVECLLKTKGVSGDWRWSQISHDTIFDENDKPIATIGSRKDINVKMETLLNFEKEFTFLYNRFSSFLGFMVKDITANCLLQPVFEEGRLSFKIEPDSNSPWEIHLDNYKDYLEIISSQAVLNRYQNGNLCTFFECLLRHFGSDEPYHWAMVTFDIFLNPVDNHIILTMGLKDIDAEKRLQLATKEKAERDILTGLYNRGAITEIVGRLTDLYKVDGQLGAFLLFDIDNFKQVNDTFGHVYGDKVLNYVANTLTSCFRVGDVIGRLGGDEFVVFMTDLQSSSFALKKAEETCAILNQFLLNGTDLRLSCSIGIALCTQHGEDYLSLYSHSDIALYRAKNSGKGCAILYNL